MESVLPEKVLNMRAYHVFVEELSKHLKFIRENIIKEPLPDEASRILAARFHTIKGGAGFFGLNQLMQLASELETELLRINPNLSETTVEKISQFEQLASQVPAPR